MPFNVAIIGYGYWGPVLHRNFAANPDFAVKYICDRNLADLSHPASRAFAVLQNAPQALTDPAAIFADPAIDLVVIATQAASHASLIRRSLDSGKNVFVEKPFALDLGTAETLTALAAQKNRTIWVDHTFLFNPAYAIVKRQLAAGAIGRLRRIHSTRVSFGHFQTDADIFAHLAIHDAYLLCDLLPEPPYSVTTVASSHLAFGITDAAIAVLAYRDNLCATLLLDLNFPEKKREIVFAGSEGSLVWDELHSEKLRLYRHSAIPDPQNRRIVHNFPAEPTVIAVPSGEALAAELAALAAHLRTGAPAPCTAEKALPSLHLIGMMQQAAKPNGKT